MSEEQTPETKSPVNNRIIARSLGTVAVVAAKAGLDQYMHYAIGNEQAKLSTTQLQDTDATVQVGTMNNLVPFATGAEWALTVGALYLLWNKPVKNLLANRRNWLPVIIAGSLVAGAATTDRIQTGIAPAMAGSSHVDSTEYVTIGSNETAFAIPMQGANRKNQAEFMSEQFLRDNKVATKRFQVPHMHYFPWGSLTGLYIPATQLLVVDRTPFVQDWQDGSNGTSPGNQGFHMQTSDGIALSFGLIVSASVKEEDAARFVYNFGARPVTGEDPTYASVVHGRSLADVMDTKVRGAVQAALSREYGSLTADQALAQKATIMTTVQKEVTDFYAQKGITIETVGYSTSPKFDDQKIQQALNEVYTNAKTAQANLELLKGLDLAKAQAEINNRNADAVAKMKFGQWNGELKTPQIVTPNGPMFYGTPNSVGLALQPK